MIRALAPPNLVGRHGQHLADFPGQRNRGWTGLCSKRAGRTHPPSRKRRDARDQPRNRRAA